MLASPLYPTTSFSPHKPSDESPQYRPAKDMEAFNSLLPPAIEFVEGSSSGTLILGEGKYEPINASPKAKVEPLPSPSAKARKNSVPSSTSDLSSLYTGAIDTTWPLQARVGCGFNNIGNTCFLNSALQCLIYTPPLVRMLTMHPQPCRIKGFCMACALRQTMLDTRHKAHSFTPYLITTKLQLIAKHMRRGRQEDSHEFLRYAIDALQKSCLANYPPKIDPKLAETTWVHKIFGGRLRSRVTCQECGFHSDTFDRILDLSIDIYTLNAVRDALRKFVAVDHLKGANKYKCEKCKKFVAAEKQFTIHEAPAVLTIHLKRFTPMGRKVGHAVKYDDKLLLQPYMSESTYGPTYSLYAIISHAGGGPNSGHYYAHIKDGTGHWHEMNDEAVTRHYNSPLSMKNAYVLFYVRDKGQALESAISLPARQPQERAVSKNGVVANMKKRKIIESEDENEDTGVPAPPSTPFIGPRLPSPSVTTSPTSESNKKQKLESADRQAQVLKQKIQAVTGGSALQSLAQYGEDDEDEDEDEASSKEEAEKVKEKLPVILPPAIPAIPPSNFYGKSSQGNVTTEQKRKSLDGDGDRRNSGGFKPLTFSSNRSPDGFRRKKHFNSGGNPYSRLKGSNNLDRRENTPIQYGKKRKRSIF